MRHRRLSYRLILQVHSFGKEVNPNCRLVGKKQNDVYTRGYTHGSINMGREGGGEGERERERERERRERGRGKEYHAILINHS